MTYTVEPNKTSRILIHWLGAFKLHIMVISGEHVASIQIYRQVVRMRRAELACILTNHSVNVRLPQPSAIDEEHLTILKALEPGLEYLAT